MLVKIEIYQFSANATPIAPALAATDSATTSDLVTNGIKSLQHLIMASLAAQGFVIEFLKTDCWRIYTLCASFKPLNTFLKKIVTVRTHDVMKTQSASFLIFS